MPVVFLPADKMNLDIGPAEGSHMWIVKDAILTEGGYARSPKWSKTVTVSSTGGTTPNGSFTWNGGGAKRLYYSDDSKIREWDGGSTVTDVSGSTYTSSTYGMRFASFGPWCLAANGVDKLQIIEVPSAVAQDNNFSDHDSNVYATISADSAVIAPKFICSHKNHAIATGIIMKSNYGLIDKFTTAAGAAFTNQPAGDTVQVRSTNAADVTQTVYVYGTVSGDTVVSKSVALAGVAWQTVTPDAPYSTWQKILAVKVSAITVGNVEVRETSGAAAITSIGAGSLTVGVSAVAGTGMSGGNNTLEIVADGATTKQIGLSGYSNSTGAFSHDSQALTGTTAVQSNLKYLTLLEVFTGDLEATRTVTVKGYEFGKNVEYPYMCWISQTDNAINFGDQTYAPSLVGSDWMQLYDGEGKISGTVDCGDSFIVFKTGSITRVAGPPWTPSVISYTTGMLDGTRPHKQNKRVYFYGSTGLCYINLENNEIVELFAGVAQRGITNYAAYNNSFITGGFPNRRTAAIEIASAFNTDPASTILSGDRASGVVFGCYQNLSTGEVNGFYFNERNDSLSTGYFPTSISGPTSTAASYARVGAAPFLGSEMLIVGYESATTHGIYQTEYPRLATTVSPEYDTYMRWPFARCKPGEGRTRITKVRPSFNDNRISSVGPNIQADVISITRTNGNWYSDGILSSSHSSSLDGWLIVDECPFANEHSVGLSILSNATIGDPATINNFTGVEVEYAVEPSRSK